MHNIFNYKVKVYYEDTDAGGIVYYANYLKYLERARTEALLTIGLSNKKIKKLYGLSIVVRSCNIEYKKAANLEDILDIKSYIILLKKASFTMKQTIYKKKELITESRTKLVLVNKNGKLQKVSSELIKKFNRYVINEQIN